VGVMAGAAPQSAIGIPRTGAQGQLLDMANDFERARGGTLRHDIVVHREGVLQRLSRHKVAELLARIGHPRDSKKVTLLANAVASGRIELGWIDDGACGGMGEMPFDGAVATFTGNRFGGENRRPILIERTRNIQRGP